MEYWNRAESQKNKEGLLSIGQMSDLTGLGGRALRLYQKKGLLDPRYVDDETGYRYYAPGQVDTAHLIVQMQSIGFTLAQIREIMDKDDLAYLLDRLREKHEEIIQRQFEAGMLERATARLVDNLQLALDPPALDEVQLELLPERVILAYDVQLREEGSRTNGRWLEVLQAAKAFFDEKGYFLPVSDKLGSIVYRDNIADASILCDRLFVFVDEPLASKVRFKGRFPKGQYLTMYLQKPADYVSPSVRADRDGAVRLLEYARQHNLEPAGDLYDETLVTAPISGASDGGFIKLYLPVARRQAS